MKINRLRKFSTIGGLITVAASAPLLAIACGDDTPTQAQLDAEQLVINALTGDKKANVSKEYGLVNNATFTTDIAKSFGLTNFTPKSGYTYVYGHPILATDGSLALTINVKAGSLVAKGAVAIQIAITGLDLAKTKTDFEKVKTTSKTETNFKSVTYATATNLDAAVFTALGIASYTFPQGVTATVKKAANSADVEYVISKTGQTSQTFTVTFNAWGTN